MPQVTQTRHISLLGTSHFLFGLLSTIFLVSHIAHSSHSLNCLLQWHILSKAFPVHLTEKKEVASELSSTYLLFISLCDCLFMSFSSLLYGK